MIVNMTRMNKKIKTATVPTGIPFSQGYTFLKTTAVAPSMCMTVTASPGS